MNEKDITEKFEWFCSQVGGEFSEEEVYSITKLSCKGLFDLELSAHIYGDGTKSLSIRSKSRGFDVHLEKDDALDIETLKFVDKVESHYRSIYDYNQGSIRLDIDDAERIELRIGKNDLYVLIA